MPHPSNKTKEGGAPRAAPKIFVVEDDAFVADLTKSLLDDAGFETLILDDSREVLDLVRKERPDLVLLDILMPGIDGMTLCHTIKNDPELKSVKVAVVSGKAFEAERRRAARYGADAFIPKPYAAATFAAQIRSILTAPVKKYPMPIRALVIDDDPSACELTEAVLGKAGFEVSVVQDAVKAMAAVKAIKPDVVVLDIMMPGLDGLTICDLIKTDPELKETKIAVVSAKAFDSDRKAALRYGADLFVVKPYKTSEFPAQLLSLVNAARPEGGEGS